MFLYAAAYCTKDGIGVWGDGGQGTCFESGRLPKWASVFEHEYERYPRLDPLSKCLALVAGKVLGAPPCRVPTGVVMATGQGSLDVDLDYYRSAVGSPELASPKLFPYTLPSAGLAEILIRYQVQGPSLVFWQAAGWDAMLRQLARWMEKKEIETGLLLSGDAWSAGPDVLESEGFAVYLGQEARGPEIRDKIFVNRSRAEIIDGIKTGRL